MKPEQLDLIGEAVIDAVKQVLPALIREAVTTHLAAAVAPAAVAAITDREAQIVSDAVAATMRAHASRIEEFRRFDETVLAAMREELNRMRTEFDDGLQKHYAEVRRELSHETAVTIATHLAGDRVGPQGPPGRDGTLAASVHWVKGAHVARGSCVQHKGGLWFANADSDVEPGEPCSGYSLLLDGERTRCEMDAEGYVVQVITCASGKQDRVRIYRPEQYAGIYDGERDYLPNDIVTCEGSRWVARVAHFGRRPGTDLGATAWTLTVKRGKDGKDGEPGPAGAQGPPGEAPPTRKRASANGAST